MSLEDALKANTEALERHTAVLTKFMETAKAGKAAPAEAKAEDKPAPKAAGKGKAKKEPWETNDDFVAFVGKYLASAQTKDDKVRVRNTVTPILDHFGVTKFSEIGDDQREEAYGYVKQLADAAEEGGLDAAEAVDLGLSNEEGSTDDLV